MSENSNYDNAQSNNKENENTYTQSRNGIYFEYAGSTLFNSINFEHRFKTTKKTSFGYRIGFYAKNTSSTTFNGINQNKPTYMFPLHINFSSTSKKHQFIYGAGVVVYTDFHANPITYDTYIDNVFGSIDIIYRKLFGRSIFAGINITPIYTTSSFFPSAGIQVGLYL